MTFDPKWAVLGVAVAIFGIAASYDVMLGLAAGVTLAAIIGISLWIRVSFAFEEGQEGSNRSKLARRFNRLSRNRREAQAKEHRGALD
ncbi:MAG: hypothetical protein SXU28_03730 [Pseudomonadota bacterium]|nr:hypothetical protein [Pseudomonadota bacterium]